MVEKDVRNVVIVMFFDIKWNIKIFLKVMFDMGVVCGMMGLWNMMNFFIRG